MRARLGSSRWVELRDDLAEQWRRSRLLRLFTLLALVILIVEGLLRLGSFSSGLAERARELQASNRIAELQLRDTAWATRLTQAQRQWQALESMLWQGADDALLQASIQDTLRSMATRSGLTVRELTVSRQLVLSGPGPSGNSVPTTVAAKAASPEPWSTAELDRRGIGQWTVRITLEFRRVPLMNFLSEVAAFEKALVTERVDVRVAQTPAAVELQLRALSRHSGGSSTTRSSP